MGANWYKKLLYKHIAGATFFIESLGYDNEKTTQSYLAPFEDENKREISKALTAFN